MKERFNRLKKLLNKITVKQIILIIIFGIIISLSSMVIGYYEFSKNIRDTYNKECSELANLIKLNLNIPEYEEDLKLLSKSFYIEDSPDFAQIYKQPGYQALLKQNKNLLNSIDGLSIFIGNYNPSYSEEYLKYLKVHNPDDQEVISYLKEGDDVICTYYRSPDLVPANRNPDYPGGLLLASDEEKYKLEELYRTNETQYQKSEMILADNSEEPFDLFSAIEPINNDNGDIIGYINVSMKVTVIQTLLVRYILLVGVLTILLGIIFIFIYIALNRRMFINPILNITNSTNNFVKNNNKITTDLEQIRTGDEIQSLAESILKMEKDINEYIDHIASVTAEREKVKAELDLATNIQMSMLPQEVPEIEQIDNFDLYAIMNPAKEVGGDFYNYYMIDEDHLGFVVGDVSGKGVPAALFMMIGTILIKTQSLPDEEANIIMEHVNDILSTNNAAQLFITSWMGIYEISTGRVTFVNAGHEPPLLIKANGEVELVKTKPNLFLGSFDGIPYTLREIKLEKGDKIFLYTDGVVEAQNANQEFYQDTRLIELAKKIKDKNVKDIVIDIREDIDVFVNGADQFDDITILGLEVNNISEI